MRIAIIGSGALQVPRIGGSVHKAAVRKARQLCQSGHRVWVFDSSHAPPLNFEDELLQTVRVPHLSFNFLGASSNFVLTVVGMHLTQLTYAVSLLFALWGPLRKGQFDVIQTHIRYDAIAVMFLQKLLGTRSPGSRVPMVFTCHNSDWQRERLPLILRVLFIPERFALRHSTAVVAISHTLRANLIEKVSVSPPRIRHVYEKPDTTFFRHGNGNGHTANGRPNLVCVSDIIPRKNQMVLVEALPRIAAAFPEAKLLLVGGTPDSAYLALVREAAERLGVLERITVAGRMAREEMLAAVQQADICLVPTFRESSPPLVLWEALCCGRAVIASRLPEIVELNDIDGEDVFPTAAVNSPEEWADSILSLASDDDTRRRYENNADRLIASVKDEAHQYLDIYQELVS